MDSTMIGTSTAISAVAVVRGCAPSWVRGVTRPRPSSFVPAVAPQGTGASVEGPSGVQHVLGGVDLLPTELKATTARGTVAPNPRYPHASVRRSDDL